MTPADLAGVPADRIVSVQLCDVLAEPMTPLRSESLGHRLPPGQGHGDAVGLVRALDRHGVRPRVVAVEVISDELVARGVDVAAQTAYDAAARGPHPGRADQPALPRGSTRGRTNMSHRHNGAELIRAEEVDPRGVRG